ncbi:MAG: hypothetical protein HYT93_04245 [Parcubacteria group bacterium]|nr:hypothetical protein [Parcubacteria group bacterium]
MSVSPSILSLLFWIILTIVVIASTVFIYHWQKYGTDAKTVKKIITIYSIVTVVLLIIAWILLQASV